MSKQEYHFDGTLQFAQLQRPDKKYNDYRLKFYPKDAATRKAIKETGTQCNVHEDDDGFYFQFKNEIRPNVTDAEGNPVTALVGNGSTATMRIMVEKFTSAKYGDIARTKLTGVVITNLIPYEPKKEATVTVEAGTADEIPS